MVKIISSVYSYKGRNYMRNGTDITPSSGPKHRGQVRPYFAWMKKQRMLFLYPIWMLP